MVSLLKRSSLSRPITSAEHDTNLAAIEDGLSPSAIAATPLVPAGTSNGVPLGDWMGGRAIDPRAEGCRCDGTDDAAALQAMIDKYSALGGALIRLPRNRVLAYSKTPVLKPGVWIEGHGPSSVLRNLGTNSNPDWQAGLALGNMHPYAMDAARNPAANVFEKLPLANALRGSHRLTFSSNLAANLAKVTVGSVVIVRDPAEWSHPVSSAGVLPFYSLPTRVTAKDATWVYLADPIEADIVGGFLSPVSGTDPYMATPWTITYDNVVRDLTIDSPYSGLGLRGGAYGLRVEEITLAQPSLYIAPANCTSHAILKRIKGRYSAAFAEVACLSHWVTIDQCEGRYESFGGFSAVYGLQISEHSRHVRVRDCAASSDPAAATSLGGNYWLSIGKCYDVEISGNVFRHTHTAGAPPAFGYIAGGNSAAHVPPAEKVSLRRNMFDIGATAGRAYLLFVGLSSAYDPNLAADVRAKKVTIVDNHVVGDLSAGGGAPSWLFGDYADGLTIGRNSVPAGAVVTAAGCLDVDTQIGVSAASLADPVAKAAIRDSIKTQGRASILDFIPAQYHAAIQAGTGTAGSYDVAAAFALAMADTQCGGMHVPWGLYNLASMATISKPFSLIGHGGDYSPTPSGTVFRVAQDKIGIKADADSIELRGLVLDGSAGGGTPDCKGGIGVWFTFKNKVVVHNCYGVYFRLTPFYLDGSQNCDFQSLGCYYSPINFLIGGVTRNLFLSKSTLLNLVGVDPAYVVSRYGNNRNLFGGHLPSGGLLTYLTSTLGLTQLDDTSALNYPSKIHVVDTIAEGTFNETAAVEFRGFYDNIHLRGLEITDAGAGGFLLKTSQPGPATGAVILDSPTLLTNQGTVASQPGFVSAGAGAPVVVRGPVYTNKLAPVRGANVRPEYEPEDQPPYRAALGGSRRLADGVGGWFGVSGSTVTFDATNQRTNFVLADAAVGAQCGGDPYRGLFPSAVKANLPGRVTGYCSAFSSNIGVYATRTDAPFQTLVGTITGTGPFTFDYVVGGTYDGGLRLIPASGTSVAVSLSDLFNGWMI